MTQANKPEQYRQGDIFFKEVSAVPSTSKRSNSPVLAYGEVTGHCHQLMDVDVFDRYDTEDAIYVSSQQDMKVGHDEHDTIPLKGNKIYQVKRQREYDPLTSLTRQVAD